MSQRHGRQEDAKTSESRASHRPAGAKSDPPGVPGQGDAQPGTSSVQKPLRVQRRKTKRERNHAKFGRTAAERSLDQRGADGAFHRVQIPHRGTRPVLASKGTCLSNPVIITQSRLTQHLGMFNREVKSADIGRLLGQDKDPAGAAVERSSWQRDSEGDRGGAAQPLLEEVTMVKCSNPGPSIGPTRSGVQDRGSADSGLPKDKELQVNIRKPATGPHSADGSRHPTPSSASGGHAVMDAQARATLSTIDKENTPLRRVDQQSAPVKEMALKLLPLLNHPAVFPGRSLIKETRQSIIAILLKRYGKVPDISALTVRHRLDYSLTPSARKGGCRSVSSCDVQHACERGTGSKDPCRSQCGKRRRKQSSPLPFSGIPKASSSAPALAIAAEGAQSQKENLDLFEELRIHGHHRQCVTSAMNPELPFMIPRCTDYSRPSFPMGWDHTELDQDLPNLAVSKLEPRSRETFEECLPPRNPPKTVWDTRSSLERNTDAFRHALKRNKTCGLPFNLSDSTAVCSPRFTIGSNPDICANTQVFPYQHQAPCRHMTCSPETFRGLVERENPTDHVLRSCLGVQAQDIFGHREPKTGWKRLERMSLENPNAFDVLGSIWSGEGEEGSVAHPCGAVQSLTCQMSYREPCPDQGPQLEPKKVLQLHPSPRHPEEVYVSGLEVQDCACCAALSSEGHMSGIPRDWSRVHLHVADPKACHQKSRPRASGDHNRAQPCMASWNRRSSAVRGAFPFGHHDHGGKRCQSTGDYLHTVEHGGFPELPISFFPPSEVLEQSLTPTPHPYTASTGLLFKRSSPDSWVFPRMKLY